jgi:hypothetical protein
MPNATTQDVRISPPPLKNFGYWGYIVDHKSGQRILYWDRDLLIPEKETRKKLLIEYKLQALSLLVNKKKVGNIKVAIITRFDAKAQTQPL